MIAEKVKELATCQNEIKALRATEALKDKAIEEVTLQCYKLLDIPKLLLVHGPDQYLCDMFFNFRKKRLMTVSHLSYEN